MATEAPFADQEYLDRYARPRRAWSATVSTRGRVGEK